MIEILDTLSTKGTFEGHLGQSWELGGSKTGSTNRKIGWKFLMFCVWNPQSLGLSQIFMHFFLHTVYLKSRDIWCREQAMDLHWNIFCHVEFKVLGSSMTASRRESQWLSTIQRQDVSICRPQHQRFWCTFSFIVRLPFSRGFCCKMQGERLIFFVGSLLLQCKIHNSGHLNQIFHTSNIHLFPLAVF